MTGYLVREQDPRGAVIVCPGGGYVKRAAHEGAPVARWLNSLGISAFVLDYRVAPYRHPYPLMDAQRAVRLVRYHADDWGINRNRVAVLGFSAGGHLAATIGTHYDGGTPSSPDPVERMSCRPDALILCYPVISFVDHPHQGSAKNLLGSNPPQDLLLELSNEKQVDEDTPPAFIWHTANDAAVPVENSLLFAAALSRCNVPFELHVYPEGPHGLGLAPRHPDVATWIDLCACWLKGLGFMEHHPSGR